MSRCVMQSLAAISLCFFFVVVLDGQLVNEVNVIRGVCVNFFFLHCNSFAQFRLVYF